MSLEHRSAPAVSVDLELASPDDKASIQAAIRLGDLARDTLGQLPWAAYHNAAAERTLLLARAGGEIVGYALYGVTRTRVRLTHLCVAAELRGQALGHRMVDWISSRHHDSPGILVKCRANYDLGKLWIKLGFKQISVVRGRSKAGHQLTCWWRDHDHANLFTRDLDDIVVRAAIDLNILRDLAEPERPDANESAALLEDQFSDRLELIRTPALDAEIDDNPGARQAGWINRAEQLIWRRADPAKVAEVRSTLLATINHRDPAYPASKQDRFDLDHVTHAIALEMNVFVTRDNDLANTLGPAARDHYALRILRPGDVLIHLDELARAEAYRPAAFRGTSFSIRLIGVDDSDSLADLANTADGERPREFVRDLRRLATEGWERIGIYDPDGRLVTVTVVKSSGSTMTAGAMRVAEGRLADTLARQSLFQLRERARSAGTVVIQVVDQHPQPAVKRALLADGFLQDDHRFHAFAVDLCSTAAEIESCAADAANAAGVAQPHILRSQMGALVAAELERTWWPAKILDSQLPTYVIPIRQGFSADLLGVPEGLVAVSDGLGLVREHVYYRSPRGPRPQAPARLLWYLTATGRGVAYPAGITACSQLDAVVTGSPDELFSRFQHLGVWDRMKVHESAFDGVVQALRFTNTEIMSHMPLARLQKLAARCGQPGFTAPLGPRKVSPEFFASVYREGRSA